MLAVLLPPWLGGCQTSKERLLTQGYTPAYASGFDDGCGSGRQAAGALGEFRKNVSEYLKNVQYSTGWDDGFRQCQASADSDFRRHLEIDRHRDREWTPEWRHRW